MSPVPTAERVVSPPDAPPRASHSAADLSSPVDADRHGGPPRRPARKRRRPLLAEAWRWLVTGAIFAGLASGLLGAVLIAAIYRQARTDQTRPVEAIVVLGTAQFNGRPGRVLQARLNRALAVYEAGTASLIVVTGGRAPGDVYTEAEAAQGYLIERGVPPEAILLENEGQNTWGSMRGVAALLADADLGRVLLVSDGFHLFRVKLMARQLGLTAFASAAPESPIRHGGGNEFSYVVREAAAVVVHLWRER